jgi:hypothetical protein
MMKGSIIDLNLPLFSENTLADTFDIIFTNILLSTNINNSHKLTNNSWFFLITHLNYFN